MWRGYLDFDICATHTVPRPDDVAVAYMAKFDKPKPDGMPKGRRMRDRGHPAQVVFQALLRKSVAGQQSSPLPRHSRLTPALLLPVKR